MNSTINNENMMQMVVALIAEAIAQKVAAVLALSMTAKDQAKPVDANSIYTVATAAEYLGDISERKLRSMVAAGVITHRRIGTRLMFTRADLDTYIDKKAKRPARF